MQRGGHHHPDAGGNGGGNGGGGDAGSAARAARAAQAANSNSSLGLVHTQANSLLLLTMMLNYRKHECPGPLATIVATSPRFESIYIQCL